MFFSSCAILYASLRHGWFAILEMILDTLRTDIEISTRLTVEGGYTGLTRRNTGSQSGHGLLVLRNMIRFAVDDPLRAARWVAILEMIRGTLRTENEIRACLTARRACTGLTNSTLVVVFFFTPRAFYSNTFGAEHISTTKQTPNRAKITFESSFVTHLMRKVCVFKKVNCSCLISRCV